MAIARVLDAATRTYKTLSEADAGGFQLAVTGLGTDADIVAMLLARKPLGAEPGLNLVQGRPIRPVILSVLNDATTHLAYFRTVVGANVFSATLQAFFPANERTPIDRLLERAIVPRLAN